MSLTFTGPLWGSARRIRLLIFGDRFLSLWIQTFGPRATGIAMISVTNLSKYFGPVMAVDRISFEVG